jgi:rhodanese-related sulfurtransferase
MATGRPEDWAGDEPLRRCATASFTDLAAELARNPETVVLDVRRHQERAEQHITGSAHIPIHEVLDRLGEIPAGPVWVHCAGGYRAGVVAALLDAHGVDVVAIDDSFDNAGPAGLPLATPARDNQEIPA